MQFTRRGWHVHTCTYPRPNSHSAVATSSLPLCATACKAVKRLAGLTPLRSAPNATSSSTIALLPRASAAIAIAIRRPRETTHNSSQPRSLLVRLPLNDFPNLVAYVQSSSWTRRPVLLTTRLSQPMQSTLLMPNSFLIQQIFRATFRRGTRDDC